MIQLSYIGNKKGLMDYIGAEICGYCFGTGECSIDEMDKEGNWQSGTGIRKCECSLVDNDE